MLILEKYYQQRTIIPKFSSLTKENMRQEISFQLEFHSNLDEIRGK
jgi:hypothetical protein